MIYSLEDLEPLIEELDPLMKSLWQEVDARAAFMEQEVDYGSYLQLFSIGAYKPYTVRTEEGKLTGFIGVFITPSLHCKGKKEGITDVMYIHPKHRGCGSVLLKLIEDDLKEEGVYTFSYVTKEGLDGGHLAGELGFKLYEKTYKKRL